MDFVPQLIPILWDFCSPLDYCGILWHNSVMKPKKLRKLLTDIFTGDNEYEHTIPTVEALTNTKLKDMPPDIQEWVLMECEAYAVQVGIQNDKSFAKWYLERYHPRESALVVEGDTTTTPNNITLRIVAQEDTDDI